MKPLSLPGLVLLVISCGGNSGTGVDKKADPTQQGGGAQQSTQAPDSETVPAGLVCGVGETRIQGTLGTETIDLKGTITNFATRSFGEYYNSASYETAAGGKGFVRHDIGNPGQFSVRLPDGPMLCSKTFKKDVDSSGYEITGWIKATKYDGGMGPLREGCFWQNEAEKEAVAGTLRICFRLPQSASSLKLFP